MSSSSSSSSSLSLTSAPAGAGAGADAPSGTSSDLVFSACLSALQRGWLYFGVGELPKQHRKNKIAHCTPVHWLVQALLSIRPFRSCMTEVPATTTNATRISTGRIRHISLFLLYVQRSELTIAQLSSSDLLGTNVYRKKRRSFDTPASRLRRDTTQKKRYSQQQSQTR